MLVWAALGVKLRDLDCAFKLIRRRLLDDITPQTFGAMVNAELMTKLHRRGVRFKQIGVTHYPRLAGETSGGRPDVIVRAFRELFRLRRLLRSG
jgi:hypothetical protein